MIKLVLSEIIATWEETMRCSCDVLSSISSEMRARCSALTMKSSSFVDCSSSFVACSSSCAAMYLSCSASSDCCAANEMFRCSTRSLRNLMTSSSSGRRCSPAKGSSA